MDCRLLPIPTEGGLILTDDRVDVVDRVGVVGDGRLDLSERQGARLERGVVDGQIGCRGSAVLNSLIGRSDL